MLNSRLVFPRAEDIRADAHHRGSMPDRNGPIPGHADGQLRKAIGQLRMLRPDPLEQRLDPGEIRLDHPLIIRIRRHSHQASDPDVLMLRKHTL